MRLALLCVSGIPLIFLAATAAAEEPPSCKPVERYGVKGCEILRDQTCPPGYHKQVVDPPNPMMKGPSYLMCVPDTPATPPPPPKDRKADRKPG